MRLKSLLFVSSLLVSNFTWAHGNELHEPKEYDPVDNEFGSYMPKLDVSRTIEIKMSDNMRFGPDTLTLGVGDVVRFKVKNDGTLLHEMVIGTEEILSEHAELMKKFPGMEHDEPYMAHVQPGKTMEIIWRFDKPGRFGFACLIPGHFESGMKGEILVQ